MEESCAVDPGELAEDFMVHVPLPPQGRRRQVEGGWLIYQPGPVPVFANVSAVRAADLAGVATLSRLACDWFGGFGRRDFMWFLGPLSRPVGIVDYLLEHGAQRTPSQTAMFLSTEPPESPGIEVREVLNPDQLLTFRLIQIPAGGMTAATSAMAEHLARTNDVAWDDLQAMNGRRRCYLAHLEGEPVAAGALALTTHHIAILAGGATLAAAQGQGCYRALVRARWEAAVAAGAGHLSVVASEDSRPILTRLGFETASQLTVLRQPVEEASPSTR